MKTHITKGFGTLCNTKRKNTVAISKKDFIKLPLENQCAKCALKIKKV